MKKLTDKDAILCVSIEEAIGIMDKFEIDIEEEHLQDGFKQHIEVCIYTDNCLSAKRYAKENGYKITKASKILNKGVSKKELLQRIKKLEKVMIDNTEVTVSTDNVLEFIPDVPKNLGIQLIKNELTELPEKWCVKDNETVTNWACEQNPSWGKGVSEMYFHNAKEKNILEYGFQEEILQGYTEITFEQFKKWVLKEYSGHISKSTFSKIKPIKSKVEVQEKPLSIREVQVKVNSQEEANECAEIAKGCGEEIGNIKYEEFYNYFRKDVVINEFQTLRYNKDYQEISIQEFRERFGKAKKIDWSIKFQYVENKEGKWVVLEDVSEKYFYGCLVECVITNQFLFAPTEVIKEGKILCTEPITLSN